MEKRELLNLVTVFAKMKSLKRNGWVRRGIKDAETSAEHTFSTAILAMLLTPPEFDQLKCLKLALIHDLPESFCGDIVSGEMEQKEKDALELDAMLHLSKSIGHPELYDLFTEFLAQETTEAKFIKALDQLDNIFTARFYEDTKNVPLVSDFWVKCYSPIHQLPEELRKKLMDVLMALS